MDFAEIISKGGVLRSRTSVAFILINSTICLEFKRLPKSENVVSSFMPISGQMETQIVSEILSVPLDVQRDQSRGDGAWTKRIFKRVGDLGQSLGYAVCSSRKDVGFDSGWLYDLIWYRNGENHEFLHSVSLILECEWNTSYKSIKYDFEKLLVCRADLKIMIFQSRQRNIKNNIDLLERGIAAYSHLGVDEVYLLICFNLTSSLFEIKRVKVQSLNPHLVSSEVFLLPTLAS
jgi:hypothetical protein